MEHLIIGIDPDITKNGVAIFDKKNKHIETKSLAFFELLDYFLENKSFIIKVNIECGFLNKKSNWHNGKNSSIMQRIAKNVGENNGTAKHIVEMCEYLKIEHVMRMPLKKIWKGADKKITQLELNLHLDRLKITHTGTKNQDARDSVLIALYKMHEIRY